MFIKISLILRQKEVDMALSLTKDEFLKRYFERNTLFSMSLEYDIGEKSLSQSEIQEYIGKLIANSIIKAIDLVYREDDV